MLRQLLSASIATITILASTVPVFANPLNKFESSFNPDADYSRYCTDIPIANTEEIDTNRKQDDNGSQTSSSKHSENESHNRSSEKSGNGKFLGIGGGGKTTSSSEDKRDMNFEDNSEFEWDEDSEFSKTINTKTYVDLGLKNCDVFNQSAAERDKALFTATAKTAIASSNADRDIQVAGIEADAQKNINYEQQQTQRMAIKAQEKVKLRGIEIKGQMHFMEVFMKDFHE